MGCILLNWLLFDLSLFILGLYYNSRRMSSANYILFLPSFQQKTGIIRRNSTSTSILEMLFENNMDLDSSSDKLDELQAFIDNKFNEQINKTTIASMINEFRDHLNSEKRKRESANSSPQSNSHQSPITTIDPSKRAKTSEKPKQRRELFKQQTQRR